MDQCLPSHDNPTQPAPRRRQFAVLCCLRLAFVASLATCAAPAIAQPTDKAWIACLRQPERSDDLVPVCTAVIDSAKATAMQRAAALNNRGADLNFRGGAP